MTTETCKLYSTAFWIFLPNIIKIDPHNFELYRFNVWPFLRHSVYPLATIFDQWMTVTVTVMKILGLIHPGCNTVITSKIAFTVCRSVTAVNVTARWLQKSQRLHTACSCLITAGGATEDARHGTKLQGWKMRNQPVMESRPIFSCRTYGNNVQYNERSLRKCQESITKWKLKED